MSTYAVSTRGLAAHKLPQGTLETIMEMLYANSEKGIAKLDFSDFTGMYQDRARTIPYTAVEQTLGSFTGLNGVTATAPADVNRGVVSARVNLFTESEFRNGVTDASPRGGLVSASTLPGYSGALAFAHNGSTDSYAYKAATGFSNTPVVFSVVVRMDDGSAPRVGINTGPSNDFRVAVNGAVVVPSQQEISPGVYRLTASATVTSGGVPNFGVIKYGSDSAKTFKVTAYDLRLATDANLPYQRVNTATEYDTVGFPHYLKFNGTNTAYATPSIDFTGTDKMTVWAGVTKLSGTTVALIASSGVGSGSFELFGQRWPAGGSHKYAFGIRNGSLIEAIPVAERLAPDAAVLTGIGNTSVGVATLRINGVDLVVSAASPSGVNYGNYPLSIGSRAGTQLYFNGRLYSLIVRGAQSSLSQIEATENLIRKTMRLP